MRPWPFGSWAVTGRDTTDTLIFSQATLFCPSAVLSARPVRHTNASHAPSPKAAVSAKYLSFRELERGSRKLAGTRGSLSLSGFP